MVINIKIPKIKNFIQKFDIFDGKISSSIVLVHILDQIDYIERNNFKHTTNFEQNDHYDRKNFTTQKLQKSDYLTWTQIVNFEIK